MKRGLGLLVAILLGGCIWQAVQLRSLHGILDVTPVCEASQITEEIPELCVDFDTTVAVFSQVALTLPAGVTAQDTRMLCYHDNNGITPFWPLPDHAQTMPGQVLYRIFGVNTGKCLVYGYSPGTMYGQFMVGGSQ